MQIALAMLAVKQVFSQLLVITTCTSVSQAIPTVPHQPSCIHLIHSGMVKTVVLLKLLAARLLIFHGSTENLTLVLLTSLSYGYVAMHKGSGEDVPVSFYEIYVQ